MTRTLTAALAVGLLAVASHAAAQPPAKKPAADKARGKELFDGKSLDGWKAADYTGGGKVVVKDGAIVMELGEAMTGVVYRRGPTFGVQNPALCTTPNSKTAARRARIADRGEQNAPLGRAVIGGLMFATVTTLFVVPIIYTYLRTKPPVDHERRLDEELAEDINAI